MIKGTQYTCPKIRCSWNGKITLLNTLIYSHVIAILLISDKQYMQYFNFDTTRSESGRTRVHHVPKKLLWLISLAFGAVLVVLLVIAIYFGVKRNTGNRTINDVSTLLTTNASLLRTTTSNGIVIVSTPSPSIARVPDNLQQLSYHLTITPDLTNKTFTG